MVDRASTNTRSDAHRRAVNQLAALVESTQSVRPVWLLGAGASFRSGVPLADEAVTRIAREVYAKQHFGTNSTARVMPGDIARFLAEQPWYIKDPNRRGDNFPLAVRQLLVPREYRRDFFSRELRAFNSTSPGYVALARLAQRGLWRIALTTNFDRCIVDAVNALAPHVPRPIEINQVAGDHVAFNLFGRAPQVVYLHGAVDSYTDLNTDVETERLPRQVVDLLRQILSSSPLVVAGYRGGEPSIMSGLFEALLEPTQGFRCGVYWCDLGRTPLHQRVNALRETIGGNFVSLTIDGFDELIVDLDMALAHQAIYSAPREAPSANSPKTIRPLQLDDLDHDLIVAKLAEYCDRVGRPRVDRARMWGLLGEIGLVEANDAGGLSPTAEGLLVFGNDVQSIFPQACVDLTFGGKRRQLIRGNLLQQFGELRRILEDPIVNPELRVKMSASSQKRAAYNSRSVTEMIVNMLVHRDYQVAEASRVDVDEGHRIRFMNPGGLPESALKRLVPNSQGEFVPLRSVTEIRNYGIADVFYGIGPMDKRGSGLCDARDLMLEHGGDARYAVEEDNKYFVAELLQPRQKSPRSSETAISLHPFGVYVTNHLRFEVLPLTVTAIDAAHAPKLFNSIGADLLGEGAAPRIAPVFIRQKDRVVTFGQGNELGVARGTFKTQEVEYFRTQPGGHGTLSHLLREHFVVYLREFRGDGLFVEPTGHRAYFVKQADEPVKIRYDGSKRSGLEREMVKRRELRSDVYHENEGFAFDVVRFQGCWAVQIKPFYMFTGSDGRTPLSPFRRARLATSRMKFDRNPNVMSDLAFWARYLARGAPTVQLCSSGSYDLLLSGAFHEIEVADPALETDG